MDREELKTIAQDVAKQLFNSPSINIKGNTYKVVKTKSSRLLNITIEDITFMEQNQRKKSKWAQMAKEGAHIIWIFKNNSYIGRIVDGDIVLF
jgi:hypothetical protein